MALEKLCLSLMSRSAISADDYPEFVRLGKLLELDEETVYEWDFWKLLMLEGHGGVE
jgi:hypothetical protein